MGTSSTNFFVNFRLIVGDKGSVPLGEVLPVVFANLPLKEDTQEYPVVYRALEAAYQEIKASGILGQYLAKVCSVLGSSCFVIFDMIFFVKEASSTLDFDHKYRDRKHRQVLLSLIGLSFRG